jgi:hypothetical protein
MSQYVTKIRTNKGDLPVDYNSLANLPELNTMFSNPNLLINSDFRNPINQRGETTYQEASDWTYCIDRWKYFNQMTVQVLDGVVKFESHGAGKSWFMQEFENELPIDNYTLSVKVSSVLGTCDMKFENSNGVQSETVINRTGVITATFNGPVNAITFELDGVGSQLSIEWIKLEQGTIATTFVQRLREEELLICRRYYRKYWTSMVFQQFYSNQYYGFLFDTPMRADPTVKLFSILSVNNNSSVGANVEVYAQGVYKFHTVAEYTSNAIIVPMLELDAEIY